MNSVSLPRFASSVIALAALLVVTIAGVAVAATVNCTVGVTCIGTSGPDTVRGTEQGDDLRPGTGNDTVFGKGGNDTMYGNLGNDTMYGGDGADQVNGHPGDDFLNGGDGPDLILTADGRDEAYGSGGNDTIRAYRDNEPDFVNCGNGSKDSADVQSGDYVDGTRAATLVGTSVTSCEKVIVNGIVVVDLTGV